MSKSEKLYKDSPKVGRDKDGKPAIEKGEKKADVGKEPTEADAIDAGDDGVPVQAKEMHGRHMQEMKDMHGRHEKEHKDMHKRHQKEIKGLHGDTSEDKEEKAE